MKYLLVFLICSITQVSFANYTEKIIDENDLVVVNADGSNLKPRLQKLIDAFGKLDMGCTATHIGSGYVLTAGHCFWAGDNVMENEPCEDTKIEWGFREGVKPYMVSQCQTIIAAQQDGVNDYALLKVSPAPDVAIAPDTERRAIIGDTVTIFSHPEELPLRWSKLCGIEREQHPDLPAGAFHHKCDTNPGSSGATVLNFLTLKVVGIHDGGTSRAGGMNYGTYIMNSPLYEHLKKVGF